VTFVPGVVFALAGSAPFEPMWGSLWNLTGATFGATLVLLIPRYVARANDALGLTGSPAPPPRYSHVRLYGT